MRNKQGINIRKFGLRDLHNMYKKRGWKLPLAYLMQNFLFDFTRGVSTHHYIDANELEIDSHNAKHSVLYMSSWTRIIRESTRKAVLKSGLSINETVSLIDIGSGKGKVLLVWEEVYGNCDRFSILGVEFSPMLNIICKKNLKKTNSKVTSLYEGDILNFSLKDIESNIVFYMYNPFDEVIMEKFLNKVKSETTKENDIIFIYNNPVHDYLFTQIGIKEIFSKNSWHPNGKYKIYKISKELSS